MKPMWQEEFPATFFIRCYSLFYLLARTRKYPLRPADAGHLSQGERQAASLAQKARHCARRHMLATGT